MTLSELPEDGLDELVNLVMRQGFDLETAGDIVALVGDTPFVAEDGRWIVRDESGKEIARVKPFH